MTKLVEPIPVRTIRVGHGQPLVLIHPFTTDARIWTSVADHLADEFDVLMVTLPGHWGSDLNTRSDVSITGMADAVEEMMDDAGFDTAHIAGNSLGGWLSLELAKRGRARSVTAIAPAGGWGRFDLARGLPVGLRFVGLVPLVLVGGLAGRLAGRLSLAHHVMLKVVSADWRKVERQDSLNMMRASTHCPGYGGVLINGFLHGGARDLDRVDVPVRLVLCEKDHIIPPERYATLFQEQIPDVHTIMLEGVGHVPMLEAPELVAEVIAEHALQNTLRLVG